MVRIMRLAVFGDIHGHWCDFRDAVAKHRKGRTEIVCLSDFHRDPENSCIVLDTSTGAWKWPGKYKGENRP